ncbi:hypothetical protein Aperf_G00000082244 [Anoplocephala perfoliata]
MFESGYLILLVAEKLVSASGNHSLIGRIISRCLNGSDFATWTLIEAPGFRDLFIALCILSLAVLAIILGPLIQTFLSFSRCKLRRKKTSKPKQRSITVLLISFISCWLLLIIFFVFVVILFSENLNFNSSQGSGFVGRIDGLSHRTFALLRSLTNETKSVANDTINGILNDFHTDLLLEIPKITSNFLNGTNLNTPLFLLSDLAKTVEDLLNAHTYLRKNGQNIAMMLENLDSNIRANVVILLKEIQETRTECAYFINRIPSLKTFHDAINELAKGLYKEERHNDTFHELFKLESSIGLFNMLNVLPFNVTEVTEQLKSAMRVRDDLEKSIRDNIERRFTLMTKDAMSWIDGLSDYVDKGQSMINHTERDYKEKIKVVTGTLNAVKNAWIIVYFIGIMVATAPSVLLICSCACTRRGVKTPIKEKVFPLLRTNEPVSASSSGCGSSEDDNSTLTAQEGQTVPAVTFPASGTSVSRRDLFLKRGRETSISFDSDSGCPRSDCQARGLWSRTGTFDTLAKVKITEYKGGDSGHRRCKGSAHLISCCGLLILSLICLPLIFSVGYFHVNVCLPFVPNSTRQHQLDKEINDMIEGSWVNWMNLSSSFVNQQLKGMSNSTDTTLVLENHIRISIPRDLVSALLTKCSGPAGNESLFKAISLNVKLNFTGLLNIPVIKDMSIVFKGYFVDQAVEMMLEKLEVGLLPSNFELLLQTLITETKNETSEEPDSTTAFDTADRFWSQAINGAVEREQAIEMSLTNLQTNNQVLKKVHRLQQALEKELDGIRHLKNSCSAQLSQMLGNADYALRLIRSRRKGFRYKDELQGLQKAAATLRQISQRPSFTKSLSNFAELAYNMGLSKASTNASRDNLLLSVDRVIGMEYDRLANAFETNYAAKSINARIAAVLERFTAPCERLGALAWDAVGSTCIVAPPVRAKRNEFVPIEQRMAAVGLAILLLISLYSLLCLIYICITKYLSSKCHN